MAQRIQVRRDTAANFTTANPILAAGEFGYETNTKRFKIGDGATAWSSLPAVGNVPFLLSYTPAGDGIIGSGTGPTLTAISTTNCRLAVVVPPTGKLLCRWSSRAFTSNANANAFGGFLIGSTAYGKQVITDETAALRAVVSALLTGLTPGPANIDAAIGADTGYTGTAYGGPNSGPLLMEAWPV